MNPRRCYVPEILPRPGSAKTGSMSVVGADDAVATISHAPGQIAVTCERYVNCEGRHSNHDEGQQSVAGLRPMAFEMVASIAGAAPGDASHSK